jgi:hypothetical protein
LWLKKVEVVRSLQSMKDQETSANLKDTHKVTGRIDELDRVLPVLRELERVAGGEVRLFLFLFCVFSKNKCGLSLDVGN